MEQQLSWRSSLAIQPVVDDGDSQSQKMGGVQAQLMGASGQGDEFDPAAISFDAYSSPAADAHLPVQWVINLVGQVVRVKPERKGDLACLVVESSLQQGDIVLVHLPFLKLDGKIPNGPLWSGPNHQPGGSMSRRCTAGVG
jgi:hypothetical protein